MLLMSRRKTTSFTQSTKSRKDRSPCRGNSCKRSNSAKPSKKDSVKKNQNQQQGNQNSLIDPKRGGGSPHQMGPSAPPQSFRKPDADNDLNFPEVPSNFIGGGPGGGGAPGGGGSGGDTDFDDLARRFDQLKKK